jgi:hypothetical protein
MMLRLQLRPPPLPRIESRRLSSLPWLQHARPWMRHRRASMQPPSLGRRRRPSPVTWNSSSPLPKGSQSSRTMMTIAPSTPAPTLMPPSPRTCMRRLLASRTYNQWSRSFWNPRCPTTSGGMTSCFSHFVAMPSMTTSSLMSLICPSIGLD